ncbi:unnamed protein product [Prunus brigantina]
MFSKLVLQINWLVIYICLMAPWSQQKNFHVLLQKLLEGVVMEQSTKLCLTQVMYWL